MRPADFALTLSYGKEAEQKISDLFIFDDIQEAPPACSQYDIVITNDDQPIYLEVKRDRYLDTTNNICIEYESNGIPSGISVTTADYYVYFNNDMSRCWLIDTNYIRQLIDNRKYHRNISCGYKSLSRAYLFNVELFNEYKYT